MKPQTTGTADLGVAVFAQDRASTEMGTGVMDAAAELGWRSRPVSAPDYRGELTALIGLNCNRGLAKLLSASRTPNRVVWFGEPLPSMAGPEDSPHVEARSRVFALGRQAVSTLPRSRARTVLGRLGGRMADLEPWDNLRSALQLGSVAESFAVTSRDSAAILEAAGMPCRTVPFGYSPRQHGALQLDGPRDLGTVVLGGFSGPRSRRRKRIVEDWKARGLQVTVVEGVWGDDRNSLLRRSRVVLQVHRFPGTFIGIRLVLALAAGAVVVSEPMRDPYPFVPGIHFIEAPLDRLPEEARALLADEPRRRRIAEAGQELLAGDLSMVRSLGRVLTPA